MLSGTGNGIQHDEYDVQKIRCFHTKTIIEKLNIYMGARNPGYNFCIGKAHTLWYIFYSSVFILNIILSKVALICFSSCILFLDERHSSVEKQRLHLFLFFLLHFVHCQVLGQLLYLFASSSYVIVKLLDLTSISDILLRE